MLPVAPMADETSSTRPTSVMETPELTVQVQRQERQRHGESGGLDDPAVEQYPDPPVETIERPTEPEGRAYFSILLA
jgi:hypothetical protein